MDEYGRSRLPYPYSYTVREVFSNGISLLLDSEPIRNNCNLVILELTDEKLHQLTSALQAGCDLIYPGQWQEIFDFWHYANILANTGNFVNCSGNSLMSICDIVADCISTAGGPANIAVNNLIVNSGAVTEQQLLNLPAQSDLLDCIWGASFATYELVLDTWLQVKQVVDNVASLAEAVAGAKQFFKQITPAQVEFLEALNANSTALVDTYLNLQSTQDTWACGLFNCIRSNGVPYEITNDCIDDAFSTLNFPPPFDGFGIGSVLGFASDYGTMKSFWERNSDDNCNNDWKTVCGLGCSTPLDPIRNWLDERIVNINPMPNITNGGERASWSTGWSPITIVLDNAYCWGGIQLLLQRGSSFEPNAFNFQVDDGVVQSDSSGGTGSGNISVNMGNEVGQVLTISAFDASDNNAPLVFDLNTDPGFRLTLNSVV